jgi:hypothetical protein
MKQSIDMLIVCCFISSVVNPQYDIDVLLNVQSITFNIQAVDLMLMLAFLMCLKKKVESIKDRWV